MSASNCKISFFLLAPTSCSSRSLSQMWCSSVTAGESFIVLLHLHTLEKLLLHTYFTLHSRINRIIIEITQNPLLARVSEQDRKPWWNKPKTIVVLPTLHRIRTVSRMRNCGIESIEQRKERTQNTITIFGWIVVIEKTRLSSVFIRALENQSDG